MSLHLHSAALEAWLTEPEDEYDPLANVEFPRETRNPRKIARNRIRFEMRKAIMHRGPFHSERGFTYDRSPRMRAHYLAKRYRYEMLHLQMANSPIRREHLFRSWRWELVEARACAKPLLP